MRRVSRPVVAILALLGLGGVLAYFTGVFHPKVTAPESTAVRIVGEPLIIELKTIEGFEMIPGTVRATSETIVGARLLAAVTEMYVNSGSKVKKGTPLLALDDTDLRAILRQQQQALSSAQAALEEASSNKARAITLFESKNLSRADYDRAMTNFRVVQAEASRAAQAVAEARAQLGYTQLVAPMSGTVVERYVEPGDTATPGQPLIKLFNPGALRVEAVLRESPDPSCYLRPVTGRTNRRIGANGRQHR